MNHQKTIYIYFNEEFMGSLIAFHSRGSEVFTFEYDTEYLRQHPDQSLDPDLQLYKGTQFTNKKNFGLFMDSAPDRWGRKLMQRREAILARQEKRKINPLFESDYLLGVYDETRMGALRFKSEQNGNFMNDDTAMAAPPWTRLRELEEACRHLDQSDTENENKWLTMLIAPGSSLGGARPKASVCDNEGHLWIAKFPAHNDTSNTAAWEFAAMLMMKDCGIRTSEFKLEKFSKYGSTFLTKRFDRKGSERIHFASAMTLLGRNDGANADSGESYLDLVEFIIQCGSNPQQDLQELWKRIAFSVAVSNTDDHLRNHGFLLENGGWRLSPAYDVNPFAAGTGLSLNINEYDNSLDFDLVLEVAPYFRLKQKNAESELKRIRSVVSAWNEYASRAGIGRAEQEFMQNAFRY
ncbi:MAG: type II toxin-antitoxin system HipA family toxin [Lentisphaeria bacterium]|nr:type II toxin-antitoxin system HipA family toxin [Lentisphaeria bacterium]